MAPAKAVLLKHEYRSEARVRILLADRPQHFIHSGDHAGIPANQCNYGLN